ncbi:transporter family protein [Confluentibacter lentus]|uniref:hypothetical protein n=1 Tax=Confluentibacter lentus TaxID=1699412 RepID=UPI000C294082|nr:hypothetical protein [Confluentibacter lentus]
MINVFQNFKIKTILLSLLGLFFSQQHQAAVIPPHEHSPLKVFCDLCGCSTSSGSSGFGTLDNLSFVGLRYIYQDYESRDGIFSNSPTSNERFNTYQVWGRVPVNEKLYFNAIVPYQDLYRHFEDRTEYINGLGDITVIGWYQFKFFKKHKDHEVDFNHVEGEDEENELSGHRLNLGIGVKLPTGEFENRLTDRINPGFQVGTGSLDGIFSVLHSYSKNRLGVNSSATYYLKTENKNEYRFGNQFSFSSNVYYNVPLEKSAFSPFLGISGDVYNSIKQFNEALPETNGNIVNGAFGSEFMINKFIVGANYTFPISQNLFGDNVTSKNRFMVYLNYVL